MTKAYVSGKFEEAGFAAAIMNILEDEGYAITHDWTGETLDGLLGLEVSGLLEDAAVDDLEGVQDADFLLHLHHDKCKGALVEIGAALGLDKPVIVIGGRRALDVPIFYWHPNVFHVANIDEALALLKVLFPTDLDAIFGSEEGAAEPAQMELFPEDTKPAQTDLDAIFGSEEESNSSTSATRAPCRCPLCAVDGERTYLLDLRDPEKV